MGGGRPHNTYEWSPLASWLVAALAIPGAPLLVVLARRRGVDVRRRWGRWFLGGSLFFLYGLDAMALVLYIGLEAGQPLRWYLVAAVAMSLVYLAITPLRGRAVREAAVGLGLIWVWTILLPTVPWNDDKTFIRDIGRLRGESLEAVQTALADYYLAGQYERTASNLRDGLFLVPTIWPFDDWGLVGPQEDAYARDLDLVALQPVWLQVTDRPAPWQRGCVLRFHEGLVTDDVTFFYD